MEIRDQECVKQSNIDELASILSNPFLHSMHRNPRYNKEYYHYDVLYLKANDNPLIVDSVAFMVYGRDTLGESKILGASFLKIDRFPSRRATLRDGSIKY